jgi:hypothetical protein
VPGRPEADEGDPPPSPPGSRAIMAAWARTAVCGGGWAWDNRARGSAGVSQAPTSPAGRQNASWHRRHLAWPCSGVYATHRDSAPWPASHAPRRPVTARHRPPSARGWGGRRPRQSHGTDARSRTPSHGACAASGPAHRYGRGLRVERGALGRPPSPARGAAGRPGLAASPEGRSCSRSRSPGEGPVRTRLAAA